MADRTPVWGIAGMALGGAALCLAAVIVFGGPFAPAQSVGVSLGEIAGELRGSALRALRGEEQPAPMAREWDIDRILAVGVGLLSALALIAGLWAFVRREPKRVAFAGVALGAAALTLQFAAWALMVLVGVLLIALILQNLPSIFG